MTVLRKTRLGLRPGLAFHRALPKLARKAQSRGRLEQRPGFNLLARFKTFKPCVVRFLVDFDVPFTNNLAEQDTRMLRHPPNPRSNPPYKSAKPSSPNPKGLGVTK
jgi:hypothetical protein